jgi:hypothetical protein
MAATMTSVGLDRVVWSAPFLLLVGLSPARAVAEDSTGGRDPSGPTVRPEYDSTKPVPPGYHVEERSLSSLIPVGSVALALSYAPVLYWGSSAIVAGKSYEGCPSNRWLVLPIAGPFIAPTGYGRPGSLYDDPVRTSQSRACEDAEGFQQGIILTDGILQVVGAALLGIGLLPPRHVLVKDVDSGTSRSSARSRDSNLRVIPWQVGTSAAGIELVGTF